MATPRNSVERRSRVADDAQDGLFLQRFWLKLVPFGSEPNGANLSLNSYKTAIDRTQDRSGHSRGLGFHDAKIHALDGGDRIVIT